MIRSALVTASTMAALTLLAVAPLAPSVAHAQATDDDAAQAHFQAAASYYEMGAYEDALREFQVAFMLSQRAELHYNLALCYQQIGDLPHAVESLERYLNEVPDVPNRDTLMVRLQNLRERAARGDTHAGDPETGESTEADPPEVAEEAVVAPPHDDLNIGAISSFSIAAIGVVGVVAFGALTLSLDGELAAGCGATRTCSDAQIGALQTYALLTDVSFGVALVGAAVGTILLLVGSTDESAGTIRAAGLRVSPLAGASTAGVLLEGSF